VPSITLGWAFSTAPATQNSRIFLQLPISAHLIAQGRAAELCVDQVLAEGIQEIAGNTRVELKYFYSPLVAWPARWHAGPTFNSLVVVFVALLWILHRIATPDQKLAFPESAVV
jgi:hypothetical protein